jgi:hypothetical protein
MTTPPDEVTVATARLVRARPGLARRRIIVGLVAQIGEAVRAGAPALDHPARERWAELRKEELRRQLDLIRILRP